MAGTVSGGGSPLRQQLVGVNRLVKELRSDEARSAVLGAAVDKMSRSGELDPQLSDLASRMKQVVTPSQPGLFPLPSASMRLRLLQATLEAALSAQPLGASVVLARAACQAVGETVGAEGAGVLQRTLEQIADAGNDQNALLAQVALEGARNAEAEAPHIHLTTLRAIAEFAPENAAPAKQSDAMVNEQLMFCQGKSPERVRNDLARRLQRFDSVIGTKANRGQYEAVLSDPAFAGKHVAFDERSQVLTIHTQERPKQGLIVQVVGDEQDLSVALEAGGIAEAMGNRVERIRADQIHEQQQLLQSANVVLAMSGSHSALPNEVAALTDKPVIATPTGQRFGEGLEGARKLIDHMNEAADGVSYVNIDNGFGAAYVADKINRSAGSAPEADGFLVVTTAGSADIPVAEQAAQAAEALGEKVLRLYDHGVNDPDGLKEIEGAYQRAKAVIVAAGLEGGLPNHVAAITQSPVVAVPTSVGYGTGSGGVAAMLCALNACAPGITVVAIDAAVKAAAVAHKISSQVGGSPV